MLKKQKMEQQDNTFLKAVSSGTVANLIFAAAFLIYRLITTKCKHCKCRSKTKCLECSSQEDSLNSKEDEHERKIRSEFEENLQNLLGKLNQSIHAGGEKIIRTKTLQRPDSGLNVLAEIERP